MIKLRTISGIEDIERVSHLSALVFRENNYETGYQWFKNLLLECPYFNEELCLVAEVDGEIVSKVQIIEYTMQVGKSTVRMAGLASVLTDPPFRKKGYASTLLKRTVQFMEESNFDISVLFGIGDFYERFGYVPVMADSEVKIAVSDINNHKVNGFKEMEEKDIDKILEYYHQSNKARTGTILRSKDRWKWMHRKPPFFFVNEDGYFGIDFYEKNLELLEIAGKDEDFYDKAIFKLASIASEKGAETIRAFVPLEHPFVWRATQYGAIPTIFYQRTGKCMARIINIHSLFKKIRPELDERIKKSVFNKTSFGLSISSDIGEVDMALNEGYPEKIELVLYLPQTALTQLITGYKPARTILFENENSLQKKCIANRRFAASETAFRATRLNKFLSPIQNGHKYMEILDVLFPHGYSFIWRADRF